MDRTISRFRHNWKTPKPEDVKLYCFDCSATFDLVKRLDGEAWVLLARHVKRCKPKRDAGIFLKALKRTEQTMRLRVVGEPFPTPQDAEERYFPSSARDVPDDGEWAFYGDGHRATKREHARR